MRLTELLDQIDQLDREATKGPWENIGRTIESNGTYEDVITTEVDCSSYCYGGSGGGVLKDKDAEFITLARTALPSMSKALRAIMELHPCLDLGDLHEPDYFCASCVTINRFGGWEHSKYPCPTVQAITDQMEGDDA